MASRGMWLTACTIARRWTAIELLSTAATMKREPGSERRPSAILAPVSEIVIRRVSPSDPALLRRVRLRALLTDPASFGSTYQREAAFPDQTWTERATRGSVGDDASTLLALRDEEPVGLVTAVRDEA